ncbi:hypothetical protein M5689_018988 [Euphorbia peplus]|nr:hypothetical protein M5689_018988 [Euphorbia peplus]
MVDVWKSKGEEGLMSGNQNGEEGLMSGNQGTTSSNRGKQPIYADHNALFEQPIDEESNGEVEEVERDPHLFPTMDEVLGNIERNAPKRHIEDITLSRNEYEIVAPTAESQVIPNVGVSVLSVLVMFIELYFKAVRLFIIEVHCVFACFAF